jgi:hypothetical protein
MTDNPELKAKILEWQRKFNIPDGDPAMALIELLDIYQAVNPGGAPIYAAQPAASGSVSAVLDEAAVEQLRAHLMPAIERLTFQSQELKQRLDEMSLDTFAQQIATYHEGIDYCTKKLDVIKKENDAINQQLTKTAGSILPITRMAVLVLMVVTGVIGFVIAVALR